MSSILFVDDDVTILQLFSAVLQGSCYTIETARSGEAALNLLKTETPALLILDIAMPHISGEDVLRYVKTDPTFAEVRVIILTAAPTRLNPEIQALADKVLLKPIAPKALREAIFSIIPPCPDPGK